MARFPPPAHAVFPGQNGKIAFATAYEDLCDECRPEADKVWSARRGKRPIPYRLGGAWELAFSPAGAWLATDAWVARTHGSRSRDLRGDSPAWSPRGGRLASAGSRGVYLERADGRSRRLVPNTDDADEVTWAPSGSDLAWSRWKSSPGSIMVGGLDGSGVQTVASGVDPSWSARGWLAFRRETSYTGPTALYVIRPGETEERELLRGINDTLCTGCQPDFSPYGAEVYSWSPDGRRLAVARRGHIYVVAARGGEPRRITKPGHGGYSPTWSPDGGQIAYVRGRAIYFVSPKGGKERLFTRFPRARHCVGYEAMCQSYWVTALDWQARPRR